MSYHDLEYGQHYLAYDFQAFVTLSMKSIVFHVLDANLSDKQNQPYFGKRITYEEFMDIYTSSFLDWPFIINQRR